ncbi:MAG: pilus (MSHA type) biogenesis protein MshL [Janthinobacterium lividum]
MTTHSSRCSPSPRTGLAVGVLAMLLCSCSAPPRSTSLQQLAKSDPARSEAAQSSVVEGARELAESRADLLERLERRAPVAPVEELVPDDSPLNRKRIGISMQNARIGQLLWILSTEYKISLAVDPAVLKMPQVASLHLQQVTGREALAHILRVFDVHGSLGKDNVLVVHMDEERVFDLSMLIGRSTLELNGGGDVFGNGKDGGSGLKSSLTIKSDLGDKGDGFDYIAKSVDAILGGTAAATSAAAATDGREKPRTSINRANGTLYVRARPSVVQSIEKIVLQESSFRQKQIQIDAQLVDVQLNDASEFGIDWNVFGSRIMASAGTGGIGIASGTTTTAANVFPDNRIVTIPAQTIGRTGTTSGGIGYRSNHFSIAVNALKTFGAVRVLSNPSVLVRNGMPAYLSVGNSIRYVQKITNTVNNTNSGSTTSVDVVTDSIFSGVVVGVSAVVKKNGLIELFIHPSQTQVSDASLALVDVGAGNRVTLPVVSTKGIATTLNIQDGDTVVIGGLIDQQRGGTGGAVPGLGDVPTVGKLFTSDRSVDNARELVVVLRARAM